MRCSPGHFAGKFTGHIYWHTARHSCSSPSSYCDLSLSDLRLERPASVSAERSDCVKQTVCANRSSLLAVGPCRSKKSTLVIIARSAKDASIYDKCSTQRIQRIKALFVVYASSGGPFCCTRMSTLQLLRETRSYSTSSHTIPLHTSFGATNKDVLRIL